MVPEDLLYSDEHEWVRIDGDIATIGITDYAQEQLGDIVYVDLPEAETEMSFGAVVGELESTKSVSELYAPVNGKVLSRNEALEQTPELINSDPYGEGWLLKVALADADPAENLISAEKYTSLVSG